MIAFKKIICAVDLSEFTPEVAKYAAYLAKTFDAEVVVVYATPPLHQYANLEVQPPAIEALIGEISAGAEKSMEKVMAEYFSGMKATAKTRAGYPAQEIIKVADQENADLIVMGTHARRGVDLFVFGSVAEKVVKMSKIPVLTLHPYP